MRSSIRRARAGTRVKACPLNEAVHDALRAQFQLQIVVQTVLLAGCPRTCRSKERLTGERAEEPGCSVSAQQRPEHGPWPVRPCAEHHGRVLLLVRGAVPVVDARHRVAGGEVLLQLGIVRRVDEQHRTGGGGRRRAPGVQAHVAGVRCGQAEAGPVPCDGPGLRSSRSAARRWPAGRRGSPPSRWRWRVRAVASRPPRRGRGQRPSARSAPTRAAPARRQGRW